MENRIKELREARGWTQQQLADQAGTTNQQIGRLENGERELTVSWMERLARPLGVAAPELLVLSTDMKYVRLIGEVQAGVWREPQEQHETDGEWITVPLADDVMRHRPFALRVVGPSMNRVYPEGTILICCHLAALHEHPVSGKRYIIEDQDPHGQVETTVKEFVVDEDGRPWAWPRSSDLNFQDPIPLDRGRHGHTITVKARVVYVLRAE